MPVSSLQDGTVVNRFMGDTYQSKGGNPWDAPTTQPLPVPHQLGLHWLWGTNHPFVSVIHRSQPKATYHRGQPHGEVFDPGHLWRKE